MEVTGSTAFGKRFAPLTNETQNLHGIVKCSNARNRRAVNALRGFWPDGRSELHGERRAKARFGAGLASARGLMVPSIGTRFAGWQPHGVWYGPAIPDTITTCWRSGA